MSGIPKINECKQKSNRLLVRTTFQHQVRIVMLLPQHALSSLLISNTTNSLNLKKLCVCQTCLEFPKASTKFANHNMTCFIQRYQLVIITHIRNSLPYITTEEIDYAIEVFINQSPLFFANSDSVNINQAPQVVLVPKKSELQPVLPCIVNRHQLHKCFATKPTIH